MKLFILLVYISTTGSDGGITFGSAEFTSKATCEAAAAQVKDKFTGFFVQRPKVLCVEK